jgi:hypothetical protein
MAAFLIAMVAITALISMSRWANRRFEHLVRLPMQWSLDGKANWTAPRRLALAFTPALGGVVLLLIAGLTTVTRLREGQEGYELPVVLLVATTFVAIHGLHLWLVDRFANEDDR